YPLGNFFPSCPVNTIDNPDWYEFTVQFSGAVSVVITPYNCRGVGVGGAFGFQAGLYTDCSPNAPAIGVQCGCTTGGIVFSASLPLGTYYLVLDGCAADVCEYDIQFFPDILPLDSIAIPEIPTASADTVCPFELITLSVPPVDGASTYFWNLPVGVVPVSPPPYCNQIDVFWGNNSGGVSVTAASDCSAQQTSDSLLITVQRFESVEFGSYCFPSEIGYFHAGTQTFYPSSIDLPLITAEGCDSIVRLEIEQIVEPIEVVFEALCPGEVFPMPFGDITSDTAFTYVFEGEGPADCDSTLIARIVTVDVVLETSATSNILDCEDAANGVPLSVSSTQPTTYEWTTFEGEILSDPTDSTILVGQSGTYTVEATVFTNGIIACVLEESFTVESVYPNVLAGAFSPSCGEENDGFAFVEIFIPGQQNITYRWSDPDSQTTATVLNLAPGNYDVTLTADDGCTFVESVIIDPPIEFEVITTFADCDKTNGTASAEVIAGSRAPSYIWSSGGTGDSQSGLDIGVYFVTLVDQNTGCTKTEAFKIEEDPACTAIISGFVFDDRESPDCVLDAGTLPIAGLAVKALEGNNSFTSFTDDTGYYEFEVPIGSYEILVGNPRGDYVRLCTDPCGVNATDPGQSYSSCDFYYQFIEKPDLSLQVFKDPVFPGSSFNLILSAANVGNIPFDAQLSFFYDPNLVFNSANIPPTDEIGNNLIWELPDFSPGDEKSFTVTFTAGTNLPNGTELSFFFSLTPLDEDLTPADNEFGCSITVGEILFQLAVSENRQQELDSRKWAKPKDITVPSRIYPNPSSGPAILQYVAREEGLLNVGIYNSQGQFLKQIPHNEQISDDLQELAIELSNAQSGVYWIILQWAEGRQEVLRWVRL
ncbi:MAG: T9SS type A sorting domain-containing protein, partial [Bacteroidota bacterium]